MTKPSGGLWPNGAAAVAVALAAAALTLAGGCSSEEGESKPDSTFGSRSAPGPPPPAPEVRRYDVDRGPVSISAGAGYVWVTGPENGSLERINPGSKRPIVVETAGFPTDVSAGEEAAWLALADRGAVQRVTGTEGAGAPVEVDGFPSRIAAGEGAIWAASLTSIERIDPATNEVAPPVELGGDLFDIAAGEGAVWVVRNEEVVRLDPSSGQESGSVGVPVAFAVTTGESAVWALGEDSDGQETLNRIGEDGSLEGDPVPVPGARQVAAGLGHIWVVTARSGLFRFDPETGAVNGKPIRVGRSPLGVTVGAGSAWVAAGEGAVYRVTP